MTRCQHHYYCAAKVVSREPNRYPKLPGFGRCLTCPFNLVVERWNRRIENRVSRALDVILAEPNDSQKTR